ncbi:unnamed protein product [Peronospora belbahrii]|uniref:Protein NO VEIN C-terminal domain-containing protein n=1 Tax=Peronospora belbahrii TaxID=622444 RepID=A0ABN8D7P5_9STRA|nr:unnamed protein product [Peronospora belbahrii]
MMVQDAFRASSHINLHEFVQFLAQQYRQPSAQAMGVMIDPSGFGLYVGMLRRIANHEMKEMKTLEQQFQREVAEKMFRLTKEKFSDENRKQALDELLQQTNARSSKNEDDEDSQKRRRGKKSSTQSLSLDMLKRVTDIDVYLDNVLRRKAAVNAKNQHELNKSISSQEIAETDSKLRNQLTRFLVSSQKSRHHSRLKVVTWVICSIMAKTYALLLSDDKLPDDDGLNSENLETVHKLAESDMEECDCCCVGKNSCTCSCTCKCHVESSDEEDEDSDHQDKAADVDVNTNTLDSADTFPVMPTDPFASRLGKVTPEVNVTLEEVTTEIASFLSSQQLRINQPVTLNDVLLVLTSLENHLLGKFSVKSSIVSWAGRRSVLELLSHLTSDNEDENDENETSIGRLLFGLVSSSDRVDNDASSSKAVSEKCMQEEVMSFVRECRAAISLSSALSSFPTEKQQQWIVHRVLVQLGCTRTEELGLPSVEELVELVDQKPQEEETLVIKYAGSLDLNQGHGCFDNAVARVGATGESIQIILTEQAIQKLRKCPYLCDVSLYMDWQERYAPICGSLLSFIRVHEMILLDHAPSNNFMFVCCLNGTILRVNEKSTPSNLELLTARAEQEQRLVAASQVAIHLVSMMVTCKTQANFPKQLVQAHLRAHLSSFAKDRMVDSYRARFVLEVLMETPVEFADFIMSLLLDVIAQDLVSGVSNDWGIADQVWKACRNDVERKTLVFISNRSLSPLWANQVEQWRTVRENLTVAIMGDAAGSANGDGSDVPETKSAPLTDASKSHDKDNKMVRSLLDLSDPAASFSNELLDQDSEDCPATERLASASSCQSFIEDLRKKQFGVGLQSLDEATTSVLLIQQKRLERALKRLSDELYSESTHFVLELLQNADDNAYDDDVVPLGDFSLTVDKNIVFYNNERGFSPENIQAICDVGASTKAAVNSEASIGKKGIGFKSVFKVSDNPQVHSNGFHICFHAKNSQHVNGMGYILPYWLNDTTQWKKRRGTTFVLPLNEASMHRVDDISQSLLAFEPSVLLFLRRIRELRLRDLARQHTVHFLKKEKKLQSKTHIVQLLSQVRKNENDVDVVQQNWLVVKQTLETPPLFSRSHSTEIALALPIAAQPKDFCNRADRPPLQQVFAYLPLRSYGFRFILQGDFDIPSSREAIINGSEWNEWLVSKVPTLVRAGVSSYISTVERDELSDIKSNGENVVAAILHLISLLPLENEVQTPFRSIIPEIMRELRQVKWLAGASSTPSPSVGELLMPSEVIDCAELTGNEVSKNMTTMLGALSDNIMMSTLNKRLLHPALSRDMSSSMKRQLRIEQLHSSHLMRVVSLSAEMNDIDWTVKILALLAKLWRKDHNSRLLRQELRLIKCFPLQQKDSMDGNIRWVSLAESHDSLFMSDVHAGSTIPSRGDSYKFYGDIRILDDRFMKAVSKSTKLRTFLTNDVGGVHMIQDHELIRHYIIPKMTILRLLTHNMNDCDTGKLDVKVVIEYGQFLSSHLASCSNCPMYMDVKANMVVAATSGRVFVGGMSNLFVILPSTFNELSHLASWITEKAEASKTGKDTYGVVSGEYFSDNRSKIETFRKMDAVDKQWQKLLVDVCDLPLLFDTASLMSDPRSQAGMKQIFKWIEAEDDMAVKRSISKQLAEHLDKYWRPEESNLNPNNVSSTISTNSEGDIFDWWRQNYWLEGSDGEFYRSVDLYLSTGTSRRLFTPTMVTFASTAWKNKDFSERVLGMKADANVSDVLSAISSLCVDSTSVSALEIDQMVRMYTFLWEQSQHSDACRDKITETFSRKMMLFVPAEANSSGKKNRNRFTHIKNAVWSSTAYNGELFALETHYPTALSTFFIKVCGVEKKPSVSSLCGMITGQVSFLTNDGRSKRCGSEKTKLWEMQLLPLLCALSKKVKKRLLSKKETKMIKRTLKSVSWLPVRCVNGSGNGLLFCKIAEQPVLATTEIEKKLQKLMLSLGKNVIADLDVSLSEGKNLKNEDIRIIQLEALSDDGDLEALLSFAKVSTISAHIESHPSSWCRAFARFTKSCQLDSKRGRKKLLKLGQLLVKAWANVFSSPSSSVGEEEIRWSVQHLNLFPTIDENNRWVSATNLYINDQAELSKQDLQQSGQLKVLGLFSWDYFVDIRASESRSSEMVRVRKFLIEFCGMKSLKEHLQYEVTVLSTQHLASTAFHDKIRTALSLAQRFLFHSYRHLYDQLHHGSIAKLASELQCVLVDGHDGFQVVYRIGNLCSLRRGVNALSRCFLDVPKNIMYMQSLTGDEEASVLSVVLMELSRKLFGARVASSVANLLYLSLLQPDSLSREQWLVETQLLPPYSASDAGSLWVEQLTTTSSIANNVSRKRTSKDFEDGEIAAEDGPVKKHYVSLGNDKTHDTSLPSFAPLANYDTAGNGGSYGMQMQRPLYPPLPPANGNTDGTPYCPTLTASSSLSTGMQSLLLPNTMSKEEREAIGRWGEEYVYNQLKQQHADNDSNLTVEWVNEKEESGLPYDLTLSSGNKVVEYIEVKSTRTTEKGVFEISMNELDQAAIHGSTYCIYRVFNAGNSALCRVIRMKNPVSLVRQRKIQLALVMQ